MYPDLAPSIHQLIDLVDQYRALGVHDLTLEHRWFDPIYYDVAYERDRFQRRLIALFARIRSKLDAIRHRVDTPEWMSDRITRDTLPKMTDPRALSVDPFDDALRVTIRTLVYSLVDLQMCHRRLQRCIDMGNVVAVHVMPDVDEWAPQVAADHPRFGGHLHRSVAHM